MKTTHQTSLSLSSCWMVWERRDKEFLWLPSQWYGAGSKRLISQRQPLTQVKHLKQAAAQYRMGAGSATALSPPAVPCAEQEQKPSPQWGLGTALHRDGQGYSTAVSPAPAENVLGHSDPLPTCAKRSRETYKQGLRTAWTRKLCTPRDLLSRNNVWHQASRKI